MRAAMVMAVISALLGVPASGRPGENQPLPGGGTVWVPTNSQKSLVDAVGEGFGGEAWEYPTGLLPREFPGLTYVSGPGDHGLHGKAPWRKPVVLKDKSSGVALSVNCYRRRNEKKAPSGNSSQPPMPLEEPDYRYRPREFHALRAAVASAGDRDVFAWRDGELLFKVEAVGGNAQQRRRAALAVAEAIWAIRSLDGG